LPAPPASSACTPLNASLSEATKWWRENLNDYYEVSLKEACLAAYPNFCFVRLDIADSRCV